MKKIWDPVRGGPRPAAPFEIWPFSPGSLNYFIGAPQNNFLCSLNLFWYLHAPSTFVNLLPELKSVLKCTIGVFLFKNAEGSEGSSMLPKLISSAPCSLVIFASCSWLPGCFGPHSPGSLKPPTGSQKCLKWLALLSQSQSIRSDRIEFLLPVSTVIIPDMLVTKLITKLY